MENKSVDLKSVLELKKLIFQEIKFERRGEKNTNDMSFQMDVTIDKHNEEELYRVDLGLTGEKNDEYNIRIVLRGYFGFSTNANISEKKKDDFISQNTVAIMMPYIRSELSLLTAQPEVECVVLPPFNINAMMDE